MNEMSWWSWWNRNEMTEITRWGGWNEDEMTEMTRWNGWNELTKLMKWADEVEEMERNDEPRQWSWRN